MAIDPSRFRRIVLGLEPNAPEHSVRIAADVAQLLSAELAALFVEEQALIDLATMPFAREFRPLAGGWQPIDPDRLFREMEALAKAAERVFAAAARSLGGEAEFKVVRGSAQEVLPEQTGAGDILVLSEPKRLAQTPEQFLALFEAARRSASAVMIVPRQIARRRGAIVVIAAGEADPAISVAGAIAAAAREDLVTIDRRRPSPPAKGAPPATPDSAGEGAFASEADIAAAFAHVRERLVVLSGENFDPSVPLRIASTRQVPVLVINHAAASASVAGV